MNGSAVKPAHEVRCVARREMTISGVKEVQSFDETSVILLTVCGEMTVEGSALHITVLDTDRGEVALCGTVDAMYYSVQEEKEKRGLFGRLLR